MVIYSVRQAILNLSKHSFLIETCKDIFKSSTVCEYCPSKLFHNITFLLKTMVFVKASDLDPFDHKIVLMCLDCF